MVRRLNGRHPWLMVCVGLVALTIALPVAAQSTGMVKGTVKDEKGQPVEGAKVTIDLVGNVTRHFETKTGKKGDFIQIGLLSGAYKVTAEKEKIGSATQQVQVRLGQAAETNLVLGAGAATGEAAAAGTRTRSSIRASFSGTLERSPTPRSSSRARFKRTRTMPRRTISSGWRWSTRATSRGPRPSSRRT